MNGLQFIFSPELIEAFGWSIIHSLWQGIVVATGLFIVLLFMKKNSAQVRYLLSYMALIILLIWVSGTFVHSYQYAKEKQAIKEKIVSDPNYVKNLLVADYQIHTGTIVQKGEEMNLKLIKLRSYLLRHFNLICTLWILGMIFFVIRLIGGFAYTRKLRTYQLVPLDNEWIRKIEEMAEKLRIKRTIQAFFSPLAKSPMTLGVIKPVILFPVSAFTGLSSKEIEAIIAHEMAHILRHDYLFNILQSMVEILFFYHPAVWFISSQIRSERENSCDNIAIETTGDKVAFVRALASIQIFALREEQLAMTLSTNKNSVLQRIKRLQKQVAMKTNFIEGMIAALVIIIGLTVASITMGSPANHPLPGEERNLDSISATTKRSDNQKDSIQTALEDKIEVAKKKQKDTKELEKVVEVAMSEQDEDLSAEMAEEINHAIDEINVDEIVREAMHEASQAMREASIEVSKAMREASIEVDHAMTEVDREEINRDMHDAVREIEDAKREMAHDMRHDMEEEGIDEETIEAAIKAASAGLDIAADVVGSIDIEGIVSAALKGVEASLNVVGDQMEYHRYTTPDSSDENLYETMTKEKKQQKKELEKQRKKLQKEMDKLDKEIDKIDQ